MPRSIVWVDPASLDALRGTPFKRRELPPTVGVAGGLGVPG
jgi:hypothetical protein